MEFMTTQAKVKTVVMGGRPGSTTNIGPMQAVGGVRGANVYRFSTLAEFVRGAPYLNKNASEAQRKLAKKYSQLPMLKASDGDGRFNVRDDIGMGDEHQIPLQFIFSWADCRIFYEREHVVNMMSMWIAVYDVAWFGKDCVWGNAYSPPRSKAKAGQQLQKRHPVALSPSEVEQLRNRWQMVTDLGRIGPMDGFQLP